jgi:FAD/FMN-containing dehydrogenase
LSEDEKKKVYVVGYGHIGDGNLHLNITVPGYKDPELALKIEKLIEPFVFEFVKQHKGSVSAEHGMGL